MPKPTVVSSMPRRASLPIRSRIARGRWRRRWRRRPSRGSRGCSRPSKAGRRGRSRGQSVLGVGRTVGSERVDRAADPLVIAGVLEQRRGRDAVDHQTDPVLRVSSSSSRRSACFTRPSRFSCGHRPRDVDHEGQHRRLAFGGASSRPLTAKRSEAIVAGASEGRRRALRNQREVARAAPGRRTPAR